MVKRLSNVLILGAWLSVLSTTTAEAQRSIFNPRHFRVSWATIVGLIQPQSLVGFGTGQVQGHNGPWSAAGGTADVDLLTGDVHFKVQGLVRADGAFIGTASSDAERIVGTIVCNAWGAGDGNSILVDTDIVPLSVQGNAEFRGNVGPLFACDLEDGIAFLIRFSGERGDGANTWIAFGAVHTP